MSAYGPLAASYDALTGDVVWECQSAIKGKYASKDA